MGNITWLSRIELNRTIWSRIQITDKVLDIGCGLEPQRFFKPKFNILCEPCEAYAEALRARMNGKQETVMITDTAQKVANEFTPQSVDSIFLLDVLEHIDKAEALEALQKLEKIARKQIIIRVPLGFIKQEYKEIKDPWGYTGQLWAEHKSGWHPMDFDETWELIGCKRYMFIQGDGTVLKNPTGEFWAIKNIRAGGEVAKLTWLRQTIVTLYDCSIIMLAYALSLIPPSVSKAIIRFAMRTVWRRVGI